MSRKGKFRKRELSSRYEQLLLRVENMAEKEGEQREKDREKDDFQPSSSPSSPSLCYLLFPKKPSQCLTVVSSVVSPAPLVLCLFEHMDSWPQGARSTFKKLSHWPIRGRGQGSDGPQRDPGADLGVLWGTLPLSPPKPWSPRLKDGASPRDGGWRSVTCSPIPAG